MTSLGLDVTALVGGTGAYYQGLPGDTLLVQMTSSRDGTYGASATQDGGGEGGMEGDPKETEKVATGGSTTWPTDVNAVDAAVLGSTGIIVEVPDGAGGWRKLTHYYPRRFQDDAVMDSLGLGPCRLIFVGRHRLHFIGRYVRTASPPTPQVMGLLTAWHSRLGDSRTAVERAGITVSLAPGDTLALDFAASTVPSGMVRAYFLQATGVYSAVAPTTQGERGREETQAVPSRFALAQNHPNPFERGTSIRFELPVATPAKVEVFDLQGRSVAILTNGHRPAGYHTVAWDRRDTRGNFAPPGVYLYRLTAGAYQETKKLLLSQ